MVSPDGPSCDWPISQFAPPDLPDLRTSAQGEIVACNALLGLDVMVNYCWQARKEGRRRVYIHVSRRPADIWTVHGIHVTVSRSHAFSLPLARDLLYYTIYTTIG